jgi:hypothetical protein
VGNAGLLFGNGGNAGLFFGNGAVEYAGFADEYDGLVDFPQYPINLLADINAILGFLYVHSLPPPSEGIPHVGLAGLGDHTAHGHHDFHAWS